MRDRRRAQDAMFEIYPAWRRAEAELNEMDNPTGPNLEFWTVDALMGESARPVLTEHWKPFLADVERLRRGERSALESSVRFLEADPWYAGSGYLKATLLRYILRMDFSGYETRLRSVVLTAVRDAHPRRELALYAQLAQRLRTDDLLAELEQIAAVDDKPGGLARYVLARLSVNASKGHPS